MICNDLEVSCKFQVSWDVFLLSAVFIQEKYTGIYFHFAAVSTFIAGSCTGNWNSSIRYFLQSFWELSGYFVALLDFAVCAPRLWESEGRVLFLHPKTCKFAEDEYLSCISTSLIVQGCNCCRLWNGRKLIVYLIRWNRLIWRRWKRGMLRGHDYP